MMSLQVLFYIIKIALGGFVCFLSILLLSKFRTAGWMSIVCGFLSSYAATIYEILIELGILPKQSIMIFNLPLFPLLCLVVPSLFFIIGFIIILAKRKIYDLTR